MFEFANKWTEQLCRSNPSKNPFHTPMIGSMASAVVIMCGDTDPSKIRKDTSVEGLQKYMEDLREKTNSPIADEWSVWISQCRRWSAEPFETYRGELRAVCTLGLFFSGTKLIERLRRPSIGPWTIADGLNKTA